MIRRAARACRREFELRASTQREAQRAASLHSAYGDLWGFASDLEYQGSAAEARGASDDACLKYAQSVAAYQRAGLALNALGALRRLALTQMRLGRLDSAQHT